MKRYFVASILVFLMAMVCSLDSWGGCTDCEGYSYSSGIMKDWITTHNRNAMSVDCDIFSNFAYGSYTFSYCRVVFNPYMLLHTIKEIGVTTMAHLMEKTDVNMMLRLEIAHPGYEKNYYVGTILYKKNLDIIQSDFF